MSTRTSNQDSPVLIAGRQPFHGSNLYGEAHVPGNYAFGMGFLPRSLRDSVAKADFVVYSYYTPIAWHLEDGWVVPPVTYSVSTAKHQGYARRAAAIGSNTFSAEHIPHGWELGLSPTQSKAYVTLRIHGSVGGYSRRTLKALVDGGHGVWAETSEGETYVAA